MWPEQSYTYCNPAFLKEAVVNPLRSVLSLKQNLLIDSVR